MNKQMVKNFVNQYLTAEFNTSWVQIRFLIHRVSMIHTHLSQALNAVAPLL
jgi:ribosomal protein S15P/S13E